MSTAKRMCDVVTALGLTSVQPYFYSEMEPYTYFFGFRSLLLRQFFL